MIMHGLFQRGGEGADATCPGIYLGHNYSKCANSCFLCIVYQSLFCLFVNELVGTC